jgi:hypothetical protein
MPITEEESDVHPTFQSDIFGLAMLLLQVCNYPYHSLMPLLIEVFAILSCFTDLTEIYRADCHTIISVIATAMIMISDLYAAFMKGSDLYGVVTILCTISIGHSCVCAGLRTQLPVQIFHMS